MHACTIESQGFIQWGGARGKEKKKRKGRKKREGGMEGEKEGGKETKELISTLKVYLKSGVQVPCDYKYTY